MAEDADIEALIGRIPVGCSTTSNLKCCCGRTDCAYLKYNCSALDDLEKEVRKAGQLGQVRPFLCSLVPLVLSFGEHYGGADNLKLEGYIFQQLSNISVFNYGW
jgi:hypothetical protein